MRDHKHEEKHPRFNRFAPIVCGVLGCDKDSTPHTNRFSTKSPDCEHGKPRKISRDLRINMFYRTRCINTPAVATNRQADPPSLLSKCFCALTMTMFVMLPSSVSSLSDWILFRFT